MFSLSLKKATFLFLVAIVPCHFNMAMEKYFRLSERLQKHLLSSNFNKTIKKEWLEYIDEGLKNPNIFLVKKDNKTNFHAEVNKLAKENYAWKLITKIGLLEQHLALLDAAQENSPKAAQLESEFAKSYFQKYVDFPETEKKALMTESLHEVYLQTKELLLKMEKFDHSNHALIDLSKLTKYEKDDLKIAIRNMYEIEGCGICEKHGAEVFWFSPFSRAAHRSCYNLIQPVEKKLDDYLEIKFGNDAGDINSAHVHIIQKIRHRCGMPLLEYMEKFGNKALQKLFDQEATNFKSLDDLD